jgi:hypothetical protein
MKNRINFYYNDSNKENWGIGLLPQIGIQGNKIRIEYITIIFLFWSLQICFNK